MNERDIIRHRETAHLVVIIRSEGNKIIIGNILFPNISVGINGCHSNHTGPYMFLFKVRIVKGFKLGTASKVGVLSFNQGIVSVERRNIVKDYNHESVMDESVYDKLLNCMRTSTHLIKSIRRQLGFIE